MAKPYDASTKYLLEHHLQDWLPLANRQFSGQPKIIDADVSTVTASADKVLYVPDSSPGIFHVELQSSWDEHLPRRLHVYNALLEYRFDLPVHTMVLLLRRHANLKQLTGEYSRGFSNETPYRLFRYQIVRTWELSLKDLFAGGVGLLPLAPLTDEAKGQLPAIVRKMEEMISSQASEADAANLWTATDVLFGLRYSSEITSQILSGVGKMEDSVTYQAIIEKGAARGRVEACREMLFTQGADKFGAPDRQTQQTLSNVEDLKTLKELGRRIIRVSSWQELMEGLS